MYFLQDYIIWLRKIFIRLIFKEYPNSLLKASYISKKLSSSKRTFLISSTPNFWVSKSMFRKWDFYNNHKDINVNIYSNQHVNKFMEDNFKNDLIFEIYQKTTIPVQKLDLFRICCIYTYGGIWLDLKSKVNLRKVLELYKNSKSNGILLYEPRKIDVIKSIKNKQIYSRENVIHNGFFFLPRGSLFLKNLIYKIKKDYLYFQDVIFSYPKEGIMNLTGPHQFTRSYFDLEINKRPNLVSHEDIDWNFSSEFGEFISPLKISKHYSSFKELKTIDSSKIINLK